MLRISAIVAAALAIVATSSAHAAPASSDNRLGGQGWLYVQGNFAEGSHFNKTASIQGAKLQIAPPNNSWSLTVVTPASRSPGTYDPAVVLVRADAISCLTAHKRTGPSYLYLDECSDETSKTGKELQDLKDRQYWQATPGGNTVNLVQNGDGQYPVRPNVHIIEGNEQVHLTTENGRHNKQLYFQAFQ